MPIFNPCEARVNIGVGTGVDENNRHGVLWLNRDLVQDGQQKLRVSFILDHPERVRNGLNYWTHRRLVHQIKKMGFDITHIELMVGGKTYAYEAPKYKEVFALNGAQEEPFHPSPI